MIVDTDGNPVEQTALVVGQPCPKCAELGIKSIAQGQFGGGAICMRCGESQ